MEKIQHIFSQLAQCRDYCDKNGLDFAAQMIDIAIEDLCLKYPVDNEVEET